MSVQGQGHSGSHTCLCSLRACSPLPPHAAASDGSSFPATRLVRGAPNSSRVPPPSLAFSLPLCIFSTGPTGVCQLPGPVMAASWPSGVEGSQLASTPESLRLRPLPPALLRLTSPRPAPRPGVPVHSRVRPTGPRTHGRATTIILTVPRPLAVTHPHPQLCPGICPFWTSHGNGVT